MATETAVVLSVKDLKKRIKKKWIIKGVSFEVKAGEVFGFLGPNGAGKTTTIRMLVDLIKPTSGSIHICGTDLRSDHNGALVHIGCIVENPELYAFFTGWENLEHFARMLPHVKNDRLHEVIRIVGLEKRIHDKVGTYSLGMRQRLGIAQALLGKPKLLILDEPTNGLDPQGIKEMREFIRGLAEGGLSVFVSSHLLSEIQLMCDRVAIISHGEVIAVGQVNELLEQPFSTVVWWASPAVKARQVFASLAEAGTIERFDNQEQNARGDDALSEPDDPFKAFFHMQTEESRIPEINRELVRHNVNVHSIEVKNQTLEDLFLRLTEGDPID